MVEKVVLVLAIVGAIALWVWLGRSLGRGHLGVERTTGHYLSEQETRRHPF